MAARRATGTFRIQSTSLQALKQTSRQPIQQVCASRAFSVSRVSASDPSDPHHEESFEEFTARSVTRVG